MTSFRPIAALSGVRLDDAACTGQAADDIASLRAELQALKSDYTARVSALETRIEQLESAPAVPATAAPVPRTTCSRGGIGRGSAFNPAISLILGGTYTDTSRDPESWHIGGFIPSGGEVGPGERSFNLGESELALSCQCRSVFFRDDDRRDLRRG